MNRMSIATIDAPEFINVNSVNPLISECEIKVLYLGKNRNKTYIDKSAATAIGRTLPGSPIVGYYKESKKDFTDHGEQIIFDDEGIKINDLTRPYGFIPTDAKVWFQKFIDIDEKGKEVEREYLMTVGYLWTGQYEEAKRVYESTDGQPQSMKLKNDETLQGYWTKDINSNTDFFIINDAIIQNLCILGENVEPCFEGADITTPKISSNFSKDKNFVTTLFTMMKELNEVLNKKEEGGDLMPEVIDNIDITGTVVSNEDVAIQAEDDKIIENPDEGTVTEGATIPEENSEKILSNEDKTVETVIEENQVITEEFTKNPDEDKKDADDKNEDDEDEKKKSDEKYQLLEQDFTELQNKYSELEKSYNELLEFKKKIEDEQKDALIAQFCMLSDEDKKDVIENKSKYSLDDIESKLSVICVRKKVNFNLETESKEVDAPIMTYNLNETVSDNMPAWLKAVESTIKRNQ